MKDLLDRLLEWQLELLKRAVESAGWWLVVIIGAVVVGFAAWAIYLTLTARLRRQERAHCFLLVLQTGLRQGLSLERTVVSLAATRDMTLGVHFHLLAAHIEQGRRFHEAVEEVPKFLPARVAGMLRIGEETGSVERVLPACFQTLRDAASATFSGVNNVVVFLFLMPVGLFALNLFNVWVAPKFKDLMKDMVGPSAVWPEPLFFSGNGLAMLTALLWLVFVMVAIMGLSGSFLFRIFAPATHWLDLKIPWRRRRLLRDFSAMLALLLDAGVPEARVVEMAAQSLGNTRFLARADRVLRDLSQGVKLATAVRWLDDDGEFRWRLENAAAAGGGFRAALDGWHEALDAKAFQQEQSFSQAVTTGMVFLNGVTVACFAIGVFQALIMIVDAAAL